MVTIVKNMFPAHRPANAGSLAFREIWKAVMAWLATAQESYSNCARVVPLMGYAIIGQYYCSDRSRLCGHRITNGKFWEYLGSMVSLVLRCRTAKDRAPTSLPALQRGRRAKEPKATAKDTTISRRSRWPESRKYRTTSAAGGADSRLGSGKAVRQGGGRRLFAE